MFKWIDEGILLSRLLDLDSCTEKPEEAHLYINEICKLRNEQLKMLAQFFTGAGITLLLSLLLSTINWGTGNSSPNQLALAIASATGLAALGVGALLYIRLCKSAYACVDAFLTLENIKVVNKIFKKENLSPTLPWSDHV